MVEADPVRAVVASIIVIAGVLAAQSGFSQDQKIEAVPAAQTPSSNAAIAPVNDDLVAMIEAGHPEYLKNCRTCHGSKGTAGVPLAGNEKVEAGPDYLAWAIIAGPGYMPEFGPALSDEQIALICTYILNSWGNAYGVVTPEDIAALR